MPPRLLVSVRNAAEAVAARAGGCDLLDVKEPARGPLGRADDATVAAVLHAAGPVPVSVALGELTATGTTPLPGIAYAKWGLAGLAGRDWPAAWRAARSLLPLGCREVAVAYADANRVEAPTPVEVARFAAAERAGAFLIDTAVKDGATLLDWLTVPLLVDLLSVCRSAGVPVALAGSLGLPEIVRILPLRPDWIAVRGAACAGGRNGTVEVGRVRTLSETLHGIAFAPQSSVPTPFVGVSPCRRTER
jgi:uncharacterized protein (UPF0264 family)